MAEISQQDYFLKAGESIDAYNTRIAGLRAAGTTTTTAPSTYTSQPATTNFQTNTSTLSTMEGQLSPYNQTTQTSYQQPSVTAVSPTSSTATQQPIPQPLDLGTANTALKSIIDQTNKLLTSSGIQLSPENQALLSQINGTDSQLNTAIASARTAANSNDYRSLDAYTKQAEQLQAQRDASIKSFYEQLAPLREQYIKSLAPGALETDLQNQLLDVRKKINDVNLSTKQGVQNEFGLGRALTLSTGRAEKIQQQGLNIRESFQNDEANLLGRLGLAQEARQAASKGLEAGMSFLEQDLELQQKAYDRQEQSEQKAFERFQALDDMQRRDAADMLEQLQGSDPDKLSPQVRAQIAQIAEQRGIPSDAIFSGLRVAFDREQLDQLAKRTNIESTQYDMKYKQAQLDLERRKFNLASSTGLNGGLTFPGSTTGSVPTFEQFLKTRQNELGQSIDIKNPTTEAKYRAEYAAAYPTSGTSGSINTTALSDAFSFVSARLSKDEALRAKATMQGYLTAGQLDTAKEYVKNLALANIPTEQQNRAQGRFEALSALDEVESAFKAYTAAGGSTGILKGNAESIAQKLGKTTDKRLATIANTLSLALVDYRRSVSGAAFTESEGKAYENIFPSEKKSGELNAAKIESLRSAFNRNNRALFQTTLGPKNYDLLFGTSNAPQQSSFVIQTSNGGVDLSSFER